MVSEFLPEIFTALRFQSLDPTALSQQIPFEAIMEQIQFNGEVTLRDYWTSSTGSSQMRPIFSWLILPPDTF